IGFFPPASHTRQRTSANGGVIAGCANLVPRCAATFDRFTTATLSEALAAPDVVAAFGQPMPLLYGYDSRANDGSVLAIRGADGQGLLIGAPCGAGRPCDRPVTPGMAHLEA